MLADRQIFVAAGAARPGMPGFIPWTGTEGHETYERKKELI